MNAHRSSARRRFVSRAMSTLCAAAVVLALLPLGFILFYIVSRGISALNQIVRAHV